MNILSYTNPSFSSRVHSWGCFHPHPIFLQGEIIDCFLWRQPVSRPVWLARIIWHQCAGFWWRGALSGRDSAGWRGAGDEEVRVSAELIEANSLQCSGVTKQAVCPIVQLGTYPASKSASLLFPPCPRLSAYYSKPSTCWPTPRSPGKSAPCVAFPACGTP